MSNFWDWLRTKLHPPQENICWGISDSDDVVSYNPCLRGPYITDQNQGIIQAVPDGWQIYNSITNADIVQDEYSAYARITANGFGLTFELHNGKLGIDGKWGYWQNVNLQPGCYLLKVSGHGWINDPPNGSHYAINCYLDDVLLSQQVLPMQEQFQLIYPFKIDLSARYMVRWTLQAMWASAGHGSMVDITSAAVLAVDSGYCAGLE